MGSNSRKMWRALAIAGAFVAVMAVPSCRKPYPATLGQPFPLHVGQAARLTKSDLDLYFRRVASDSRCPTGVQCIQAGEAVVTLEARILKAPPEAFDVPLASDSGADRLFDGYRIRLVRLDPHPVAGASTDSTAYVGTFVVEQR
jgi:hypothetical protein